MRTRHPGRHLPFYELLEAIQQPGCPVCRLVNEASERWLEAFFHEQVNDPGTRQRLRLSGGLCAHHTELALRIGDPLCSSILYGDLLRTTLDDDSPRPARRQCLLCEYIRTIARNLMSTLLEHIEEDDLRAAFEGSDGLCLPHLALARGRRRDPRADRVLAIERSRIQLLARECERFVARSDYRCQEEFTQSEATAWRRAARKLAGEC